MRVINLKGGLGNQLFQYAYGRALEFTGEKIIFSVFFLNKGRHKTDSARDYKLDKFNINTKERVSSKRYLLLDSLNRLLNRLGFKENGFWQSEKYFKNIEGVIRQEFTLKYPLSTKSWGWKEIIEKDRESISIHIRRGDYIHNKDTNNFHGVCGLDYYREALQKLTEKKGKDVEIFVFSDDIAWAKENLYLPHISHWVSGLGIPDYEEIYLMSLCKHNIIANSTFSWWGAWLNKNPNKIVIAPKQWFSHKTADDLDILPKEWLQI